MAFIINIVRCFIQIILSDIPKPDEITPKDTAPQDKDTTPEDEDTAPEDENTALNDKDTAPKDKVTTPKDKDTHDDPPKTRQHADGGRPINKGLYAALIATVGVAAFFAGLSAPILNQDPIEMSDLNQAVLFLEDKIDTLSDEMRALEDRMLTDPESATAPPPIIPSADDDPVLGNSNAPITIIEFSDFQCPFCARFYTETLPDLKSTYIETGVAKLVYRDFPLQNIHPNAVAAAVASECAHEQDAYWDYHDMLFENMGLWGGLDSVSAIEVFQTYAADMELDTDAFDECLGSGDHISEVASDYADGVSYGVTGTPAFFVGNDQIGYVLISGAQPFSVFQTAIERIQSIPTE